MTGATPAQPEPPCHPLGHLAAILSVQPAGQGLWPPPSPAQCRPRAAQPHGHGSAGGRGSRGLLPRRKEAIHAERHKAKGAGSSPHRTCGEQGAGPCWTPPAGPPSRAPVLLGVVDYGPDLQLPVDLRPPKFLQLHLLGKTGRPLAPVPKQHPHCASTAAGSNGRGHTPKEDMATETKGGNQVRCTRGPCLVLSPRGQPETGRPWRLLAPPRPH